MERVARAALRLAPIDRYSVLPGLDWHVILAPHAAPVRLYLARAAALHHYHDAGSPPAPPHPPATLLAAWASGDPHAFAHVATLEQLNLIMYYSTAVSLVYVSPTAAQNGRAVAYARAVGGPR